MSIRNEKRITILRYDDISVATAICVDVLHGFLYTPYYFYSAFQATVLCLQGLGTVWSERQLLSQSGS